MHFFAEPEIAQSFNWFYNAQPQQNDTDKIMDIAPFDDFCEFEWETQFSYKNNQLYMNEFKDLENFNFDFNLPHLDQKPLNVVLPESEHYNDKGESGLFKVDSEKTENEVVSFVKKKDEGETQALSLPSSSKKMSSLLEYDEIKKHFDVPITMAAKKMNIGVTLLKTRCRELKITRWPYRKLRSFTLLINNLKEMGLAKEVSLLEKQRKMLEKLPEMELNEEIKKLRQACFKAIYKKRRFITLNP